MVSPLKLTLPPPVVIDVLDSLIVLAKTVMLPAVSPTVPGMVTPPSGLSEVPNVSELIKSGIELTATVSAAFPRLTVSRVLGFEKTTGRKVVPVSFEVLSPRVPLSANVAALGPVGGRFTIKLGMVASTIRIEAVGEGTTEKISAPLLCRFRGCKK